MRASARPAAGRSIRGAMNAPIRSLAACALALAGCGQQQRPAAHAPLGGPPPAPRVEATLQLPGGDGRVHIVVMPTGYLESARCVVAVAASGGVSTSCAQRDIDLQPDSSSP